MNWSEVLESKWPSFLSEKLFVSTKEIQNILVKNILRRKIVEEAYIIKKTLLKSMIIKVKKCSLTLLGNMK